MKTKQMKKIDPENFLMTCNANVYYIEEEREIMYNKEIEKIMDIFKLDRFTAQCYITKMYPNNNILFKKNEDVLVKLEEYIDLISSYLDKGKTESILIPKSDYDLIMNFETKEL